LSAYGIHVNGSGSIIRGNNCSYNIGNTSSVGIYINADDCRIEGNHCDYNINADSNYGIGFMNNKDNCVIIRNTTSKNTTAGMNLAHGHHYCAENMNSEATAIINDSNATLGTGDRSNIKF
jgi:hypothetical protein